MGNIRDIKVRINSVTNTKQITNAMKMVAASKLRKAQERVVNIRPYANYLDLMLRTLQLKNQDTEHPLLKGKSTKAKELIVIITADKGLCGSFNSSIMRFSLKYLLTVDLEQTDLYLVGRKGYDFFRKNPKYNVVKTYLGLPNYVQMEDVHEITEFLLTEYLSNKYSTVKVIYNEFKSAIQQNLVCKQILPIVPLESEIVSRTDFVYEPDAETLIEELGKKYINIEIMRNLLESAAAEQGARMTAMDNATTNAGVIIDALTLQYNRERQQTITTEIIEVASGAEAIGK